MLRFSKANIIVCLAALNFNSFFFLLQNLFCFTFERKGLEVTHQECLDFLSHQVPTLIVYGDQDTQLGELSLSNLSNLANNRVVVMKGAGHPCYLDDPDTWHKALTEFLSKL